MSFIGEPLINWQKHYKTWPERMSFINQKENLADFKFIVGPEKTIFHAHKLIFAISSPQFENLFYLLNADTKEICLPQISSKVFQHFLNFVYTGTVEITSQNIEVLLTLSRLYDMTLLTDKCDEFIQETISKDNVFKMLEISDELPAESKCLKIIGENFDELIESEEFVKISKSSLQKIVEYEMFPCKEVLLFEALDKWAENAQKEAKTGKKRTHVGDLISKLRFGSMSSDEFIMKCAVGTILTSSEIVNIVKYLASPVPSFNPFFLKKRLIQTNIDELPLQKCLRFDGSSKLHFGTLGGFTDMCLSVDKYIYLFGYGIYGRNPDALEEYKTSTVTIRISDGKDVVSEKIEVITFDGTANIFNILFTAPVLLEPFKSYIVFINMTGPNKINNFIGLDGKTEIKENGVIFKLSRSNDLRFKYDTSRKGAIAAFLFKN